MKAQVFEQIILLPPASFPHCERLKWKNAYKWRTWDGAWQIITCQLFPAPFIAAVPVAPLSGSPLIYCSVPQFPGLWSGGGIESWLEDYYEND